MKAVTYKLNTVLAGVVGLICLVLMLVRTFMPQAILPLIDIPNLAAVCAAALVIDCYLEWKHVPKRDWLLTAVLAVLTNIKPTKDIHPGGPDERHRRGPEAGRHRRSIVHRHGLPFQHDKGSHGLRQILHPRPGLRGRGHVPGLPVFCRHPALSER